jgi:general secretion pathway protein A
MNRKLLSTYGLKWNPFSPEIPIEALYATPAITNFGHRIEHYLVREGGFALITGEPGLGKSVALRLLTERLSRLPDINVQALTRPQSNLADFYREMGALFGVPLRPHNRWAGTRALRDRWLSHIDSTLLRPVLLIDEAQEMAPTVLSELRLLASTQFDSRILLSVVLAGDGRLLDKLRRDDLVPLGSRIRYRLPLAPASRDELRDCLHHLMESAGNAALMTPSLIDALCEHALGNYRVLTTMAAELLAAGAERDCPQLDEKLYFDVFQHKPQPARANKRSRRGAR